MVMSYLKGKDIKTEGDCLVYCYIRKYELLNEYHNKIMKKCYPNGFEKW